MNASRERECCTICGQPQNGLQIVQGAGICDTCVKEGPARRIKETRRLGDLECDSGFGFMKPYWFRAEGRLAGGATTGIEAIFTARGVLGKDSALDERPTGDPEFDPRVRVETATLDLAARFVQDVGVRRAVAHIVGNGGRVAIAGGDLQITMKASSLTGSKRARVLTADATWSAGILFSRMASFTGAPAPVPTSEQQNDYLSIRASERGAWLVNHATNVAALLGGEATGEPEDIALEIDALYNGCNIHIELDNDEGLVEFTCEVRQVPFEIGFGNNGQGKLLESLCVLDLGDQIWGYPFHPKTREDALATIDAMGSDRVKAVTDFIKRRRLTKLGVGADRFDVELAQTVSEVPPPELVKLIDEIAKLSRALGGRGPDGSLQG